MTAGPNAFRGSGPKSKARIRRCADPSGLSRSSGVQPLLHYVLVPLPTRMAVGIRIDPDCGNFDHGRLPSLVRFNATTLWHLDAESGRRPQHQKQTLEPASRMSAKCQKRTYRLMRLTSAVPLCADAPAFRRKVAFLPSTGCRNLARQTTCQSGRGTRIRPRGHSNDLRSQLASRAAAS